MDLHEFSQKIAEVANSLSPDERRQLRELFAHTAPTGAMAAAHASAAALPPAAAGTGVPEGPTRRHVLLKENYLKQQPSITIHRARAMLPKFFGAQAE